jgi:4a-hydroxytetrahydrobiopterin dehydratase
MTLLNDEQIEQGLAGSDWCREGHEIVREFELADFEGAMAKANAVAGVAQELDHHPDILVHGWNKVRLRVASHDEGGITQRDLDLARRVDAL